MKRLVLTAAIAVLAAFPAAYGLIGNASFGESVPVRIPARATLIDDRNGYDDAVLRSTAGSPTPVSTSATSTPSSSTTAEPETTSAPSTEDNSGPGNQNGDDNQGTGNQGRGGGATQGDGN